MKKLCPKCNQEWEGYHDESSSNHFCVPMKANEEKMANMNRKRNKSLVGWVDFNDMKWHSLPTSAYRQLSIWLYNGKRASDFRKVRITIKEIK